ncbi:hypothetical protein CWI75_05990 [Kineobactrum sediminis]|uniref:Multidrug resistance protein MdtA-like C-terminal permuted SH3 domain-containing protein n=1 Tax=Kineobactrum sediminis TaxID=1905677 RepID=A0A2N5Y3L9_9GAMM|nr:efflux RND transporter periplasmic adaptor subunit [Kineobactrum sediminis]PLW82982.1 hypothetical protein CWI75_05990 [Kineobactrum sediminis]
MVSVKRQIAIAAGLLASAIAVTLVLYFNRPPTDITEPVYVPVTVDVVVAQKETIRIPVQAQGTVSPLQETSVMAEVEGRIVEVAADFTVGSFLQAGDILLRIDPRDYETRLARARAALKSAESTLMQEQGRADVARREWEKLPAGSQRSDEARDLYLRKPQLAEAQAQLQAASADVITAQDNLDRTIVRAPYAALIRAKHSELGQYVAPGSALADLFAVDFAEVRLPIAQTRLPYLELPPLFNGDADEYHAAPVDLYTDVGGEVYHWQGQLQRSEGVFDERSRVLFLVARVEDPYGVQTPGREPLRIGTFVTANITGKPISGLVALPRYVLRAGDMVPVIDDNNRIRHRKITALRTGGDLVYISAGLDEGDLVILTTLDNALTGSEVSVQSRIGSRELRRGQSAPGVLEEEAEATLTVAPATAQTEQAERSGYPR